MIQCGYDNNVDRRECVIRAANWRATKGLQGRFFVHNANYLCVVLHRAQHGNFCKFAHTRQRNSTPAPFRAVRQQIIEFVACLAVELQRIREIPRCKAAFLGQALGRDVVGIAIGGRLRNLDPPFANTAFEIRVCQSQRDPEVAGKGSLRDSAIGVNRVEQAEGYLGLRI